MEELFLIGDDVLNMRYVANVRRVRDHEPFRVLIYLGTPLIETYTVQVGDRFEVREKKQFGFTCEGDEAEAVWEWFTANRIVEPVREGSTHGHDRGAQPGGVAGASIAGDGGSGLPAEAGGTPKRSSGCAAAAPKPQRRKNQPPGVPGEKAGD